MSFALNDNNFNQLSAEFNQLKQQINSIQPPEYFKERVYLKYYQLVINQLDVIFNNPFDDQTTVLALQEFFTQNLKYIKVNLLTPTAIHDSETMQFLCSIVPLICGDKNPLNVLFGDEFNCESNMEQYPNLDASIPLERILKTHIISDDGTCLIPLRCITEPLILEDFYQPKKALAKHYSPYHREYKELTRNEIQRLIDHSKVTEEFNAVVELSHKLKTEKSSDLYSNLDRMCRLLRIQDAYGGRGVQEHTGEGTFIALTQFIEYYDKLSDAKKAQIPETVKKAIDHLISVSSNYKGKMDTVIETCSADRRSEIVHAMSGHEQALAKICIDEDETQKQKEDALATQNKHLNDLKESLDNNTYNNGSDKLGFNSQLLHDLQIECHINNPRDLEYFKKLNPSEMKELLVNNQSLQQELINTLANLENFIFFTHELSREGLDVILELMAASLQMQFVSNEADFYALLMTHEDKETFTKLCVAFKHEQYKLRLDLLSKEQANIISLIQFQKYEYLNTLTDEELQQKIENKEFDIVAFRKYITSKELFISITHLFNLNVIKVIEWPYIASNVIQNINHYYSLLKTQNDPEKFAYFATNYDLNFDYDERQLTDEHASLLRQVKFSHIEYLHELSLEDFENELDKPSVQELIISALKKFSYFEAYAHEISSEKFKLLVSKLGPKFRSNFGIYYLELFHFLKFQDDEEKIKIFLEWFGYDNAIALLRKDMSTTDETDLSVAKYETLFSIYFDQFQCNRDHPFRSDLLHQALTPQTYNERTNILVALLNLGANIESTRDSEDGDGRTFTPLYRALFYLNSPKVIHTLLDRGANRYEPNSLEYGLSRYLITPYFFEPVILNKESLATIQNLLIHPYIDSVDCYKNALVNQHRPHYENPQAMAPEISTFLNSIDFDTLFIELLQSKKAYDMQRSINSRFAVNDQRSEALNDLVKDLMELRNELIAPGKPFNQQIRDEFTINCLNALEKARPELEQFHVTKTIIFKFIMCLLIVPIAIMYFAGELTFKSRTFRKLEKMEDNLLRFGFFNPPQVAPIPDAPVVIQGLD